MRWQLSGDGLEWTGGAFPLMTDVVQLVDRLEKTQESAGRLAVQIRIALSSIPIRFSQELICRLSKWTESAHPVSAGAAQGVFRVLFGECPRRFWNAENGWLDRAAAGDYVAWRGRVCHLTPYEPTRGQSSAGSPTGPKSSAGAASGPVSARIDSAAGSLTGPKSSSGVVSGPHSARIESGAGSPMGPNSSSGEMSGLHSGRIESAVGSPTGPNSSSGVVSGPGSARIESAAGSPADSNSYAAAPSGPLSSRIESVAGSPTDPDSFAASGPPTTRIESAVMPHRATNQPASSLEVAPAVVGLDLSVEVKCGGFSIGILRVRQSGLVWLPRGQLSGHQISWVQLEQMLQQHGIPVGLREWD
jgi:hypothetical protein